MKILNILPSISNLYQDQFNLVTLQQIAKFNNIEVEITNHHDPEKKVDFKHYDLVYIGNLQMTSLMNATRFWIKNNENFKDYLRQGKHCYISSQGIIPMLMETTLGIHTFEGSEIFDMKAFSSEDENFGKDLIIENEDKEYVGIQYNAFRFENEKYKTFGKVLFGYGNENKGEDGIVWKNLIWTNLVGPAFSLNPSLALKILNNVTKHKNKNSLLSLDPKVQELEELSKHQKKEFIFSKKKD